MQEWDNEVVDAIEEDIIDEEAEVNVE